MTGRPGPFETAETTRTVHVDRFGRRGGVGHSRNRRYDSNQSEYHDDTARYLVDEPHRPQVEMCSDLVDKERDNPPPEQRTDRNEDESGDILYERNLRQKEIEPGEQSDYQENNQRIGESEQETLEDILPSRSFRGFRFFSFRAGFDLKR